MHFGQILCILIINDNFTPLREQRRLDYLLVIVVKFNNARVEYELCIL